MRDGFERCRGSRGSAAARDASITPLRLRRRGAVEAPEVSSRRRSGDRGIGIHDQASFHISDAAGTALILVHNTIECVWRTGNDSRVSENK